MKITITKEVEFEPAILHVKAGVRYWEDATVNGQTDENGALIPFRTGELWCPKIDIKEGRILNWPADKVADIHYKVCDAGEYWLYELGGATVKWKGEYVPDSLLCHGDTGYGDYIIMSIDADGKIKGWKSPFIKGEQWEFVK